MHENDHDGRWTTEAPPMRDTSLNPHHSTENVPGDYRQVRGWGVDLHHRPMFPRELKSDVTTARGEVRDWQVPQEKIHNSIEHPNLTPVFGTSCPPKGLSGKMRDYAYRYSEGTNRHWMTLLFADRVDMLESLVTGVLTGKPDNWPAEKAWGTRLREVDPARRVRFMAAGAAIVGAAALAVMVSRAMADWDD
ncbi:MAG TPA: hypothetical protein VNI54_10955 [Thermoanaerobaculia bacterium]|nr:hypothetical protein [Thermoanaerobaculia bacterium]